jgi:shikimate kinase
VRATDCNVVLMGMPGSGKSTLGVLLAKRLGMSFVDTDVLIQAREGRSLQAILEQDGYRVLRSIEEQVLLGLALKGHVIATGGSAAYSGSSMAHLARTGTIVFLDVPLGVLASRVSDLGSRGIAAPRGTTLDSLYEERLPLYRRWAHVTLTCGSRTHEQLLCELTEAVQDRPSGPVLPPD